MRESRRKRRAPSAGEGAPSRHALPGLGRGSRLRPPRVSRGSRRRPARTARRARPKPRLRRADPPELGHSLLRARLLAARRGEASRAARRVRAPVRPGCAELRVGARESRGRRRARAGRVPARDAVRAAVAWHSPRGAGVVHDGRLHEQHPGDTGRLRRAASRSASSTRDGPDLQRDHARRGRRADGGGGQLARLPRARHRPRRARALMHILVAGLPPGCGLAGRSSRRATARVASRRGSRRGLRWRSHSGRPPGWSRAPASSRETEPRLAAAGVGVDLEVGRRDRRRLLAAGHLAGPGRHRRARAFARRYALTHAAGSLSGVASTTSPPHVRSCRTTVARASSTSRATAVSRRLPATSGIRVASSPRSGSAMLATATGDDASVTGSASPRGCAAAGSMRSVRTSAKARFARASS